jgi:SAM-dependent methyltransferase
MSAAGATTEQLGIPSDYFLRIAEVESTQWWHRGMREIALALLAPQLAGRSGLALLDAGCGTGGMLRWALSLGPVATVAGADISAEAVALARARVPAARLEIAPLCALPFEEQSFDVVITNDVLQHVPEDELADSVAELRRALCPGGVLLARTNGGLRARRERDDWRLWNRAGLRAALEQGGLRCERVTYANLAGSLVALARGAAPRAPSHDRHGIPPAGGGRARDPRYRMLRAEARWLAHPGRTLPYGHTLLALARR